MNGKMLGSTMMAMCLVMGSSAFAQNNDRHDDHSTRDGPPAHSQSHGHDSHARDNHYDRGPGAGPHHEFYKGGRISQEYRNKRYVVNDWRAHHLSAPPRGHYWRDRYIEYPQTGSGIDKLKKRFRRH